MPTNKLVLPFLNPVKFTKLEPDQVDQYVSKHMDDWSFVDTIYQWQQKVDYCQPWQLSDSIRLQLQSNFGPVNLKLFNQDHAVAHDVNFIQVMQNADDLTLFVYEADLPLNTFTAGGYYMKISIGSPASTIMISEPFIFSEKIENSLLLEYRHRQFYDDVIFETEFAPSIRIPATIRFDAPLSKDTMYDDQVLSMTMLKSIPYRVWKLRIGGARGIPDYLVDKINRILGCSTLLIDGKQYSKSGENAKLEESAEENYPMRGWSIDLRERFNRASRIYEDDVAIDSSIVVVANVDSKGFGQDQGGNIQQVEDIE